jgi:DNA-binding CsgD family transcriptional regulator
MRRIVVEMYGAELERSLHKNPAFRRMRELEVLRILRYDEHEATIICRIALKDPRERVEDCFNGAATPTKVVILGKEMEGETDVIGEQGSIVLLRRAIERRFLFGEIIGSGSGYLQVPLSYKDGRLTFTLVGSQTQLKSILRGVEKRGFQYRVVSLKEAGFDSDSLLGSLTKKQQRVLLTAYRMGYYDVPRRTNSAEVARSLHLSDGTVVEHLRKAEKRLLSGILE